MNNPKCTIGMHKWGNTFFEEKNGKRYNTTVVCNVDGNFCRECLDCSKKQIKISYGSSYGIFFGDGTWRNI